MEYCGIDVHVSYSQICILDEDGEVMETSRVRTSRPALTKFFARRDQMKIVLEAGGSSPWVSRLLEELGHEVIVCSPRRVRLIAESTLKNDKIDAEVLARLLRMDPAFLKPIRHRSEKAQLLRSKLLVRRSLVEARTKWINTVRGLLRGFGYRVSGKVSHTFAERVDRMKLPDELRQVIEPLLEQIDLLSGEIERRNEDLEAMAQEIPAVNHLRQIPGVGPLTALFSCCRSTTRTAFEEAGTSRHSSASGLLCGSQEGRRVTGESPRRAIQRCGAFWSRRRTR